MLLGPNHTVVDRLLLLLEQILEDELGPRVAARLHKRATLVELSQLDGCEPESFGQGRHGSGRVLVVARQKDDPVPALDDRIGSQGGRNQVINSPYAAEHFALTDFALFGGKIPSWTSNFWISIRTT
ncbi:MAG: hypothetical protein JWL77_6729 [Chthonomonadaceae bacterium]|nr:hypothetical protein [Chthonomonadaceae bacterium]